MNETPQPNYMVIVAETPVAWFAILEDALDYKRYLAGEPNRVEPVTEEGQEMFALVEFFNLPVSAQLAG